MPKSYLADEPGAMRAYRAEFNPFEQVQGRIDTLYSNGHSVSKIELLILGGTWSSYTKKYQEEFIRRCLDAMNQQTSPHLEAAQLLNEQAIHRNVGLVVETRPDHVSFKEVAWMRTLGVTKVQMGLQSMDDRILDLNHRGHTVEESAEALRRLRRAGFKLVLHWMPNLLGATPQSDLEDFKRIWSHLDIQPDELKIYPCSLLKNAELYKYWQRGEWEAYSDQDLIELTAECKALVRPYCRINRVFRDIHPHHIVTGMNRLNFRQMVKKYMADEQTECQCIRCREVKGKINNPDQLTLDPYKYETSMSTEYFLNYQTPQNQIAGFLRLSLPYNPEEDVDHLDELKGAALVREVHVYGPALQFGQRKSGTQHQGVGTRLLDDAQRISHQTGYRKLAIIASVGTRAYYQKRGFSLQGTYMIKVWS
jgi:elongator complex protein 3